MNEIYNGLYQFSMYIPPMDFTIHHYFLNSSTPVLFGTGTAEIAEKELPEIKKLLKDKEQKYIFVSHFESDECGELSVYQKAFPEVVTICSNLTDRELPGFGYNGKIVSYKQGDKFSDDGISIEFVDYPSEVHLQDGLLFYENKRGFLYSADLMLRYGNSVGKTIDAKWTDEIEAIQ
jgi:flavorubredoxin